MYAVCRTSPLAQPDSLFPRFIWTMAFSFPVTWVSNGSYPNCVQAIVIWQHGTYTIQPNGSITTDSSMFPSDGRIQVQNACAAQSNIISYYNQAGLYAGWSIINWLGRTMLQVRHRPSFAPLVAGSCEISSDLTFLAPLSSKPLTAV